MTILCDITIHFIAYHKDDMKPLDIVKDVRKEYKEGTDEFEDLLIRFQDDITSENTAERYNQLIEAIKRDALEIERQTVDKIQTTFQECCINDKVSAYITLSGCVINPKYFCALKLDKFKIEVRAQRV